MSKTKFFVVLLSFIVQIVVATVNPCDEILYVPDNLKENVLFWEKVYRDISSDKGMIHDADSLRVIYYTVEVGRQFTSNRKKLIDSYIEQAVNRLKTMAQTPTALWDEEMQKMASSWVRPLSPDEILGAAERVRFQQGIKERFVEGIKRSGRYLEYIKEVFKAHNLPEALAYLPHVESSFDYTAYSKVGAAGIWQFMRGTGKEYMSVGQIVDERLDPIKATHAAAKLLTRNYRKLNSWPLAITAYNHGAKSMADAVALHGTTDIGVIVNDYQRKSFKFASKNFYVSFVAAYNCASNYKEHYGDINLYPTFKWKEVTLPKATRASEIAKMFNIPIQVFKEHNRDIRPVAYKNNLAIPKGHRVKLPSEEIADELLVVAEADTTEAAEEAEKQIINKEAKSVPVKTEVPKEQPPKIAAVAVSIPPYLLASKPLPAVLTTATKSGNMIDSLHLWYMTALALVRDGAYVEQPCPLCQFDTALYNFQIEKKGDSRFEILAQIDETIHHYAGWAGISYIAIIAANPSLKQRGMRIGQKIILPIKKAAVDLFSIERLSHHMGIEEDFFNNYKITGTDTLNITSGGQIWSYCLDNDIPFWLIMKANTRIKNWNAVRPQQIFIPVIAQHQIK